MLKTRLLAATLFALGLTGVACAAEGKADKLAEQLEAATVHAPIAETAKTSAHTVTIKGRAIRYQATAGTLTLHSDDGKPIASVFYVAYVADGEKSKARPVTFFYNGGPGSASLWLHMGSFGPVRVVTPNAVSAGPAPYKTQDNDFSLLDKSDLVFIDAIGTGYSRPLGEAKPKDFNGVDPDIDAFAKAIERYIEINNRWNSPKYLFGESYGTLRSAGLVNRLQSDGLEFNGVVLLSSILNYGIRQPGFDNIYIDYLPSFAATAWYHNRLANRPADLPSYLAEVRAFARGPYAAALAQGQDLPKAEFDAMAQKVAAYTGLSPDFVKRVKLRIDLFRFQKELLRDQSLTVGRLDSRFTGVDVDTAGEGPEYDASDASVSGAFVAAVRGYLDAELGYHTDLDYRLTSGGIGEWDWKHRVGGSGRAQNLPDTAMDLAAAMRKNPQLRLLSLNGYYDMATPFFSTEYDIAHMQLEPEQKRNITFAYYPSGHMVYLHPESLAALKVDLDKFYEAAR